MKNLLKKYYRATALVLSALVFLSACSFNGNDSAKDKNTSSESKSDNKNTENGKTEDKTDSEISSEETGSTEPDKSADSAEENGTDNNTETEKDGKTNSKHYENKNQPSKDIPKRHTAATSAEVISKREEKLKKQWNIVDAVAKAGQIYYNDYFSKNKIITKNGYMYNLSSGRKIDVTYLVETGYLSSEYLNSGCELLLLLSEDVKNMGNVRLGGAEHGLTAFAMLKNPYESSFLISSGASDGGIISSGEYNGILSEYNQKHGSIARIYPDSGEYNRILNFINMYEGKYEQYFARSVVRDDKYCFVTLSPQSDSGNIKQYILKNSKGIWEVVCTGLEKEPRLAVFVNKTVPDFNTDMLPNWSVYDFRDSINKYKNDVLILMSQKGLITGSADIEYVCGATNYYYIVLKNKLRYIARYNGTTWEYNQVSSNYDAESQLSGYGNVIPIFIVWDN